MKSKNAFETVKEIVRKKVAVMNLYEKQDDCTAKTVERFRNELKGKLSASNIIEKIAEYQQSGNFEICPRCGEKAMREKLHYNCLSRRADVYVCEKCGMDEALHDCNYPSFD